MSKAKGQMPPPLNAVPMRGVQARGVSWRFHSEYMGAKLAVYAEDEDAAWDAFRAIIQPRVASYFHLAAVEGSTEKLEVRKPLL